MPLMPVEDALSRILGTVSALETEDVPLAGMLGRVNAEPLTARITQPPFNASSMDGYAVRSQDVAVTPVELSVIGSAPAGRGFHGAVGRNQAVRIFTGAPVPEDCDLVVIQENTEAVGDKRVRITQPGDGRTNIRPSGLDFRIGESLIEAGSRIAPREIALSAAMNIAAVRAYRRPRVAILATGDELVLPGDTPRPDQIISSNNFGLSAFVERLGGEPIDLGIARDTVESLTQCVSSMHKADVLVTIGGASVGDHDLVQSALSELGLEVDFWRIAMRPGKPLMFGSLGTTKVLGLPGNPVSALVCARVFLQPMLARMQGSNLTDPVMTSAVLGRPLEANDRRQDYLRTTLKKTADGKIVATPFERQDSSMLRILAHAHGLLVRKPFAPAAPAGETVSVLELDF